MARVLALGVALALLAVAPLAKAPSASSSPFVQRHGRHLVLDGHRFVVSGVDDYTLTSFPPHNVGCGTAPTASQIGQLFSLLKPGSTVRTWAWEDTAALNPVTGQRDWAGLDRVVDAAAAHHIKLILSLSSQDGTCDGGVWKGLAWYQGGYASDGYTQWVAAVVRRYRASPAVAMWEPVNEPEASDCADPADGPDCYGQLTCPSEQAAALALRSFFDVVGRLIRRIDPHHLIEEGTIGSGQCGTAGTDFAYVGASPGLDVLSVHDYTDPVGGLTSGGNGESERAAQAAQLDKPIIAGEVGILASPTGTGCVTTSQRAADLSAKMAAFAQAGYAGALVWDVAFGPSTGCSYDLLPGDPYLATLSDGRTQG